MHFSCGGYSGSPPKKAVDQLLEDRQCDASKPRKETVANYVLGQRIMCPSNIARALEPKIYFKLFITHYFNGSIFKHNYNRVWVTRTGTTSSAGIEIFSARLRDCTQYKKVASTVNKKYEKSIL